MYDKKQWLRQAEIVSRVLENAPDFDKDYLLPPEEFTQRQEKVWAMLRAEGYDCGVVYSDEHYCGDVPYLAGNNNIIVEPVAAVLGRQGLFFIAGLESGIVAEQFCHRSRVKIRKVDIIRVDEPDYPQGLLTPEDIIREACGGTPKNIAMLTTRGIFPLGLYNRLAALVGAKNVADISEKYYAVKFEKSDREMRLIEESSRIADVMLEGMLRILSPGLRESQVAQWGYAIANELGADALGFEIMVTTGKNNRTIVARATNAVINEGDVVHIGVSPKRDGLCGAERASVVCVKDPSGVPHDYKVWMSFLKDAFNYAAETFADIAKKNAPGSEHEKRMIAFYDDRTPGLEKELGINLPNFSELKGYVTSHNTGYTECQEFYGALSQSFDKPCARQMALMLDVGVKGFADTWDDVVVEGLDYLVIEKTFGKFGNEVRVFNKLPLDLQYLVGEAF